MSNITPTTIDNRAPDVPLPHGFTAVCEWELGRIMSEDETRQWRLIYGPDRTITDCDGSGVTLRATQYSDGALDDIGIQVWTGDDDLNSDQVRELAAALLEAAAELDGLAAK